MRVELEARRRTEERRDLVRERRVQVAELLPLLEPPDKLRGRAHADVALDQRLFEPFPRRVVGRIERCDGELLGQRAPGARERLAQAPHESASRLFRLVRSLGVAEELRPAARHGARTLAQGSNLALWQAAHASLPPLRGLSRA